jgi:DNA-binding helix-hairpin-helix protein with protein kinase domain/Tfp pilus assembly protein PilF
MPKLLDAPQSDLIRLGQSIGRGAEGEVYDVLGRRDLVAKIYHEPPGPEKSEKLLALARLGNDRLFNLSAWPVDVLRDGPGGPVVGFLMKKVSQAEEVHTLHSPKSRLQKFPEASWAFLVYVAGNIARAVAAMHEQGYVIGDLNPKNILVTRKATVLLLDVDSFQVRAEGKTYRCEGGFPEYTPPELQGVAFREVDRRPEHDSFGLAVVIFQLLFMGRHPFSGRYLGAEEMPLERAIRECRFAYGADAESRQMRQPPGTLGLDAIPTPLRELFNRAFTAGARPEPREWIGPLDALAKSLKKCALHSGHSFFQELAECPWCVIETRARVRLFNFLLSGSDSRGHFRLYEIWKEITEVKAPAALVRPLMPMAAPAPSPEAENYVTDMRNRYYVALALAIVGGLTIPMFVDFPIAFFALILAGTVVIAIAKADQYWSGRMQMLFDRHPGAHEDSFIEQLSLLRRDTDYNVHRLEERWEKEAGSERFLARLRELENQKDTYDNLRQIRQYKLQQLEAETRNNQLDEFLDRFEIRDAEINGIGSTIKSSLLSYGVETAADVVEEKLQIPTVGQLRAMKLLEWRRDLERQFVYDPAKGVSHEGRVAVEKEVDMLRLRLEHELSGGAFYLRKFKKEIEESRQQLQPVLEEARQTLAQAEKDWEVTSKRYPMALIIFALVIAFFIGWSISSGGGGGPRPVNDGVKTRPAVEAPQPPPPPPRPEGRTEAQKTQVALNLYRQGAKLCAAGNFTEAVPILQESVKIDPNINAAYEELGRALYQLKRYDESIEASVNAIRLHSDFGPYYNLGLAQAALQNWDKAYAAFQQAVYLIDATSWKDDYTQAYYHLGESLVKVGQIKDAIGSLERDIGQNRATPNNRFELANLYLWVGNQKGVNNSYKVLKEIDPVLAAELTTLIRKHQLRKH